jgi:predicted MFS family arabinose efflux permease
MEQVAEREQATVNSVKELAWQMGCLVGPIVSGIVQERYGFSPLFAATAVLYALACLVTWALFRKREAAGIELMLESELAPVIIETAGD